MIEFQILAYIFVALVLFISLTLLILFMKYYFSKKRLIKIMKCFNEAKAIKFQVRQKLINNLSEFNNQIDVICEYSISFEKEYFYALQKMNNDILDLEKLNNSLAFYKAKELEKLINKNFLAMKQGLEKHDTIIKDTTNSFRIISKISVFYQEIVKDIIINFEEHISVKHHGAAINRFIDQISRSLIVIEQNKLFNDVNEVSAFSAATSGEIRKLINYLKDVNIILLAEPYMHEKIEKIEKLILVNPNFFKTTSEFKKIEKEMLKLKDYCYKIIPKYDASAIQEKKPLINNALNFLKKINKDINHEIESQNIGNSSVVPLLEWINYLSDNKNKIHYFLDDISQIISTNNPQIKADFADTISGIITYIKKIIPYKEVFSNRTSIESYDAATYIALIKKVLYWISDLRSLLINLSKSIKSVSQFTMFVIQLINTYKLTLLKLNGRMIALNSKNRMPYNPVLIIDHLNQLEKRVLYYASSASRNDEINYQLSEINYKIIEISAMISNDEKLVIYLKKILIRFNKFYNKLEYDNVLEKITDYYHKGEYYNSVKFLINKYNKLSKKYYL